MAVNPLCIPPSARVSQLPHLSSAELRDSPEGVSGVPQILIPPVTGPR